MRASGTDGHWGFISSGCLGLGDLVPSCGQQGVRWRGRAVASSRAFALKDPLGLLFPVLPGETDPLCLCRTSMTEEYRVPDGMVGLSEWGLRGEGQTHWPGGLLCPSHEQGGQESSGMTWGSPPSEGLP